MKKRTLFCLIPAFSLLFLTLSGCAAKKPAAGAQGKSYFSYFDTVSYVYSYAQDSAERFDKRSAEVSTILKEYHELFDIYHEYSGVNNLCTINRMAGGEPIKVDGKLIDFLCYARELYDLTGGEMNVMMGAVLSLWHDCRESASENPGEASLPDESALRSAAQHIDFSLLEIDEEASTVRISDPLASIDVGALGKGYATEMAGRHLEEIGAKGYVLNIGGNIRTVGTKPDGSGWTTGIRDPADPDNSFAATLCISDTACVTSGVYERFFTVNGQRYHHIIDPDTLYPAEGYSSITVITGDSGLADALNVRGTDALLAGGDTDIGRNCLSEEELFERCHTGVDEQQGVIALRDQRCAVHTGMIFAFKEGEILLTQLI